jgi:hypothetical protein
MILVSIWHLISSHLIIHQNANDAFFHLLENVLSLSALQYFDGH